MARSIIMLDGVEHDLRTTSVIDGGTKRFVGFAIVPTYREMDGLTDLEKGWVAQGCAIATQRLVVMAAEGKAKKRSDMETIRIAAELAAAGIPINEMEIDKRWRATQAVTHGGLAFSTPYRSVSREELSAACTDAKIDLEALIALRVKRPQAEKGQ
jgi:hypothetical protein